MSLPSPLILAGGEVRGGPSSAPLPSPLSLPSSSPLGVREMRLGKSFRMSLGGDRLQVLCPDRVQDPFSRGWLPRGNLQYNGVSLPPPCPVGLAGVVGFPQPISILPFRHIVPQATGPFGGWVLGGLPFPTGRFRDCLGPGLSRLPPLQLLIKLPAKYFLSFRLMIGWHVPLL